MKTDRSQYLNENSHRVVLNVNDLLIGFFEYCWAILVVLNGNSVYHASAVRNYQLLLLCVVMTAVLLIVNILLGRIRIKKRNLIVAVALCLYAWVYFVVRRDQMSAMNFLYLFVIGLPCLFLLFAELHRKDRLLNLIFRLSNVVCIFAVMSLFFWVFGVVLDMIQPNMTTRINWGNFDIIQGYWGLHFEIQRETTFGTLMYRNSGIFTEAPMLNLWANIALAVELFLRNKPSKVKIGILVATVITTMSTTGFIFIALCVLLKYFDRIKKTSKLMNLLLLLIGLLAVPFVAYAVYLLLLEKSDTVSFAMRMSDYTGGVKLWLKYPLWGSGYANLQSLLPYIYSPNGVLGFSNSVTAVLATGGLWMALPFYIAHIGSMFPRLVQSKGIAHFSSCLFFLFCTTAFFGRYIAVLMIAFGLAVLMETQNRQVIADELVEICYE